MDIYVGSLDEFRLRGKIYVVICRYEDVGWNVFKICQDQEDASLEIKDALSEFEQQDIVLVSIDLESCEQCLLKLCDVHWCLPNNKRG